MHFSRRARDLIYMRFRAVLHTHFNHGKEPVKGFLSWTRSPAMRSVKRISPLQTSPDRYHRDQVSPAMMATLVTNNELNLHARHLIAMDLATEKVFWNKTYSRHLLRERPSQPDGLTLKLAPS